MKFAPVCWGIVTSVALVAGVGCSSRSSSLPVYDSRQTGTPITVQKGRVVAVRDVLIKAPSARPGAVGPGAQIGAGAVTSVITGSVTAVGMAVGQVVGGKVGAQADDRMGEEITIEVEGGQKIIIVQERLETPLAPGEDIEIQTTTSPRGGLIYGGIPGGATRVVRAAQFSGEFLATRDRQAVLR
jgi:outer membrane lipoprotein SlyB